jgi:protein with PEP-CTERM/exosortase system signal
MKKTLLTAILALGMVIAAQAIPITGTIDMSGTATLNSTFLGSATAATAFTGVTVGGAPTGTFAGTFGSSVTWSAFSWPSNVLVAPLWTFMFGANTYSFDLANVSVFSQDNSFLNLTGSGTLRVTGFADTPGIWSFTISNPGGGEHANFMFTFANSQTAAGVPDGGSAVALLGIALTAIEVLRRKLHASRL